ncbi:PIN-like domain-containing protein [Priestia megaterium]|uniref:PIN-like domain-containing protein n=1 Tax=Priestia megaterium TaxID=1404 RepID=UPI0024363602|nr:PIN-like domain-containing protein [Priestia megaterium]
MLTKVNNQKEKLFNQLIEFENRNFNGLLDLKSGIDEKFSEINDLVNKFNSDIEEEVKAYNHFIIEVRDYLEKLINKKTGSKFNIVELIDIFKEGEIRYKYNVAPGFKDAGKLEDIKKKNEEEKLMIRADVFGDLIIWKEIIRKANDISAGGKVIYISNDKSKGDLFEKDKNGRYQARQELLEEFKYYCKDIELEIITFDDLIEKLSANTNDKFALLDIRKEQFIRKLSLDRIGYYIEDFILQKDSSELFYTVNNFEDHRDLIENIVMGQELSIGLDIFDMSEVKYDNITLLTNGEDVIYRFILEIPFMISVISEFEHDNIQSQGTIEGCLRAQLEIELNFDSTEEEKIQLINEHNHEIDVKSLDFNRSEYGWGNDFEINFDEDEFDGEYTDCPDCGTRIGHHNEGLNGFCSDCSSKH